MAKGKVAGYPADMVERLRHSETTVYARTGFAAGAAEIRNDDGSADGVLAYFPSVSLATIQARSTSDPLPSEPTEWGELSRTSPRHRAFARSVRYMIRGILADANPGDIAILNDALLGISTRVNARAATYRAEDAALERMVQATPEDGHRR